jgi:hypothetical protein
VDTALIVFIIGTVVSFLPMYWIALRLLGRHRARAKRMQVSTRESVPAGRREFLDLLRQEAAQRAISALRDALDEARHSADRRHGDYHAIGARTRQSLDDAGRLVDSLFQRELRASFREAIDAMAIATPGSIEHAASAANTAILAFERAIHAARSPVTTEQPRPQSLWSLLRNRGREWIGAGDVRATA